LGVAYFLVCLLPISATYYIGLLSYKKRRRTVISVASQSFSF